MMLSTPSRIRVWVFSSRRTCLVSGTCLIQTMMCIIQFWISDFGLRSYDLWYSMFFTPKSEFRNPQLLLPSPFFIEFLADDVSLNLIGAFINLEDLGVPHHFFNRVISHIAGSPQYLDGIRGHLHGRITGKDLGHGRGLREIFGPAVYKTGRRINP